MTSSLFADGTFRVVIFLCFMGLLIFSALWAITSAKPFPTSGRRPRFENLEARLPLDTQIGTVTMPFDGYLSAGVYDSGGHLVRTLLSRSSQEAGSVPLVWDGRDNFGNVVSTTGTYTWKALTSQVEAVDQGGVGDSFFAPNKLWPNASSFIEMSEKLRSVAVGPDNSVYLSSRQEEGPTLVKLSQDGTVQWAGGSFLSYGAGITVDNNYVYVSGYDGNTASVIQIIDPSTGALLNASTPISVKTVCQVDPL